MEDSSSSSSNTSQTTTPTQTIIITPSQLEKMGLIDQVKDMAETQKQKKGEAAETSNNTKELKIDPKKMKSKLCTLLNHTPLVMQVKTLNWVASEKKDTQTLIQQTDHAYTASEDQDSNPKFKIVSDEKSNISASEIESMLSGAKVVKSDDAISSSLQKTRSESARSVEVMKVVKSNENSNGSDEVSESTSKENPNDAAILKKECLKRIQAKMYENLKKVLDEVDSLPSKDKASLSIKPVTTAEDAKSLPTKQSEMDKILDKTKENKPCYMSSYRERKLSQDAEKVKETKSTTDKDVIEIDIQPPTTVYKTKIHKVTTPTGEVIKIDDESDVVVKIPKKRKPPIDLIEVVEVNDKHYEKIIEIPDSDGVELKKNSGPPKKAIIKQLYQVTKEPEPKKIKKRDKDPDVVFKGSAKMIRTSWSQDVSPRKRGRYRKVRQLETINIDAEEIDSEPENTSSITAEPKVLETTNSSEPPRRKRGRPRKIRIDETVAPQEANKPEVTPIKPEVEESKAVSDTPVTPRKRGRPRKIDRPITVKKRGRPRKIHTDVIQDGGETSTQKEIPSTPTTESKCEDLETTTDNIETPTQSESQNNNTPEVKVPKKRGRKSKAELEALRKKEPPKEKVEENITPEKYTQSRISGRKRKIVDYNMLNGEDSDLEEPEIKVQKVERAYKRIKHDKLDQSQDKSSNDEYGSSNAIDKKRTESENDEEISDGEKIEENENEDGSIDKERRDKDSEDIQDSKKVEKDEGKDRCEDKDKQSGNSVVIVNSKKIEKNTDEKDVEENKEHKESKEDIADNQKEDKNEGNDEEGIADNQKEEQIEDKNEGNDDKEDIADDKKEEEGEDKNEGNDESQQSETSEEVADIKENEKDDQKGTCEELADGKEAEKVDDNKSSDTNKESEDSAEVTETIQVEESEEKDGTNTDESPENEAKEIENISKEETKLKDDEVRCAICEEVVQQDLWSQHKRKVHNDLAWFSGEQPLNLDDIAVVEEILNAILQEDGVLKCGSCDIQTDSLESFVQHYKDSNICIVKNKTCDKTDSKSKGRKNKPGGAAEVLTLLFTNFTKDRNNEPSTVNNDKSSTQTNRQQVSRDQVQCAICSKIVSKIHWFHHKLSTHNNLAWRVGDKPLDLNNKALVIKILHELYLKKKPLYCDVCGGTRKSVMGFLSHKSQCQKSNDEISDMKVSCSLCNRKMLPVSLSRHMVLSHSENTSVEMEQTLIVQDDVIVSGKRKAANKAFELIRNIKDEDTTTENILKGVRFRSLDEVISKFNEDIQTYRQAACVYENCNYTANEVEDLFQHMENCMERCAYGYTCNFCLATFKYHRSVKEHVNTVHLHNNRNNLIIRDVPYDEEMALDENVSDNDDKEVAVFEKPNYHKPHKWSQSKFVFLKHFGKRDINSCSSSVYKWTLDYHKKNFTAKNLFPHTFSWERLDGSKVFDYLPKLKRSIDTATLKVDQLKNPNEQNYEWKNYKLFESDVDGDGTTTVFCGGPISTMSWLPVPQDLSQQDEILAISVLPDPDKKYYGAHKYRDKGMIQFWNYGTLNNKTAPTSKPRFEFCLAHDHGIVWCMEWCPSGCYDDDEDVKSLKRLGLLAMACSDANVYIYSILKPGQIPGKIFRSVPKFKLILETKNDVDPGEISYHATKISWSKCAGHAYVAVGYSNGAIAIFNLNTTSKLLYKMEDGVIVLKPMLVFKAHNDCVTALGLHHMNNGNRWLISGSLDRETKLWDLKNIMEPLNVIKRFLITDAVWMMHWLCAIYTYEHCTIFGSVPSALVQARNYNGPTTTFLPSNSASKSISCSDWGNVFVQANESGEVVCCFPDQLFYGFDNDKRRLIRRARTLASYTAFVAKKLTPDERLEREKLKVEILKKRKEWSDSGDMDLSEPKTYRDVCDSYGLVFCDMDKTNKLKDPSEELDKLMQSAPFHSLAKPDVYPVQSINKIALNPNKNSFLFYSCGYQVGFVRTSLLKFLNN